MTSEMREHIESVHTVDGRPSSLYLLLKEEEGRRDLHQCERQFLAGDAAFYRCPCWRVTGEMSATDVLPDHAGLQAMAESCQTWARNHNTGGLGPHVLYVGDGLRASVGHIELGGDGAQDFATDWPIPILGSPLQIRMALRQRVEATDSDPDARQRAKMAARVQKHPQWPNAIRKIAEETRPRPSLRMAVATQGRKTMDEVSGVEIWGTVRRILSSYGLSTAPSWVAYAAEQALPSSPYGRDLRAIHAGGPAPGLLVETLLLIDASLAPPFGAVHAGISGGAFEAKADLWAEAVKSVAKHREWWHERFPMVSPKLTYEGTGRPPDRDAPDAQVVERYRQGLLTKEEAMAEGLEKARELFRQQWGRSPAPTDLKSNRDSLRKRLARADPKNR